MPKDLTAASWVQSVSRDDLIEDVGLATLTRGEQCLAEHRIQTLIAGPGGAMLLATVQGSGGELYNTIVQRIGTGSEWLGRCSCPVTSDCKHCVAVILEVQRRLAADGMRTRSDWESALEGLVRTTSDGSRLRLLEGGKDDAEPTHHPLGLEVSVEEPQGRGEEAMRVLLRPVRPGRSRRWIRTGVSWRDLSSAWGSAGVRPDHRAAVTQLHAVARGAGAYYHYASDQLSLSIVGSVGWPLLQRCLDAGVELVPGSGVGEIRLGQGAASITLDLTRGEDGSLSLRPWVLADPAPGTGRQFLVGRPAHGVGHLDPDGVLTLWPIDGVPVDSAVPLLERTGSLRVPPEDVNRFLTQYYPVIARHVNLSSRDGSVPAAASSRPSFHLRVVPEDGHVLQLEWSFRYAVPSSDGGVERVLLPLVAGAYDGPRNEQAEAEALRALVPVLERLPSLVDREPLVPRPYPRVTTGGQLTVRFASELLPLLQERDDVEVEIDGELADYEEAPEAPVVRLSTTEGETEDWFDLHVEVTVAGQTVPFEPLFAALAENMPFLILESGIYFSLDQPELQDLKRLIDEAKEIEDRPSRGQVSLSAYQLGLWEELVQLGVVDRQSVGWQRAVDELLQLGDADRGVVQQPEQLAATLRPYQLDGYQWLSALWDAGLGGVLADDMGLGKTLQTLAMITRAEHRGDLAEGPVLVVAPTSVIDTWVQEAAKFAPDLRVAAVTSTRKRRGQDLLTAIGAADVVITSYTLLRLEAEEYAALPWSAMVLDEAQFVKNHRSATYQAARRVGAKRTIAITGTPLENNLMDLWSMTSLASPGLFPRPELFTERYRKPIEAGESPQTLEQLRRRIRPFMLRRTKGEVAAELPAKIEQTVPVPLAAAHQKIYDKHLQRERQRVLGLLQDMDKNRIAIFRSLTVLRQLSLDPSLVFDEHVGAAESAKIKVLLEHVQELAAEGHRALVFSSFTGFLGMVREAMEDAGLGYVYLDGSTRNRDRRIKAFREGDDPVFLISLKAGGFGLTLTEADYVFVLDPWWNPAAEAQAVDRTHRIGQTKPVHVYRLVSSGTIEEKVVALQERKRKLFATVVDSGEFQSGRISAADVRGLFDA
ncbi:SNF2-related protein [Ornithinimicrobium sp. Y1847]|uniref:DEAD/DEAH box helicase n=1 Tax=Ornithinimicrobium sp. Y1847 TaxID=3405419 RepID=UPI003B679645